MHSRLHSGHSHAGSRAVWCCPMTCQQLQKLTTAMLCTSVCTQPGSPAKAHATIPRHNGCLGCAYRVTGRQPTSESLRTCRARGRGLRRAAAAARRAGARGCWRRPAAGAAGRPAWAPWPRGSRRPCRPRTSWAACAEMQPLLLTTHSRGVTHGPALARARDSLGVASTLNPCQAIELPDAWPCSSHSFRRSWGSKSCAASCCCEATAVVRSAWTC